jgi:purine-nucleoside phosphorylase
MQGRIHLYEGYPVENVVMPIRVMKMMGVKKLIVTNAAGGINESFDVGDIMVITDHINFTGKNCLIGKNDDRFGCRFPDMSFGYSPELSKIAFNCAEKLGMKLQQGVYIGCTGPSYETPAEINMLRIMGADAVGMSTAPEALVANYCFMKVLGISCITNSAAGVQPIRLSHSEVVETAAKAKDSFMKLLMAVIEDI